MSAFELQRERILLQEQWSTLASAVFFICAVNEVAALVVVKAGAFEIFLDLAALVVGLTAQNYLFGFRFFTTRADRRIFGPRRYAMVFGGAFKEGVKVPTFLERAGSTFWWRVLGVLFAASFFFYALINAQWFTFVMLFNILFCTLLISSVDFWRPVAWSIVFLLFTVISQHGSASGTGLLAVIIAGAELLLFAALQNHLERRSASQVTDGPAKAPLQPAGGWLVPVVLFAVATVLVYPLMPGKRTNPLPKTHWAKRISQGSAKGPSLSSLRKMGTETGEGTGMGSEKGTGSGAGEGDGSSEDPGTPGRPFGAGQKPPSPEDLTKAMGDLQRQMESRQGESGQSEDSRGEQREVAEQNPEDQDIDPEQYKSKLQNLAKFGKNTADKLGGGSSKSGGPDKKNAPATRKLSKFDMKRLLPILLLLLTIASLALSMFLRKKKNAKTAPPQTPVITRAQQAAALRKLEEKLGRYAGKTDHVSDDEVIETYHLFLDFLKDHETPRADHATPDEFAVDVGFLTNRKEMQPLTRVFCGTVYGKRGPTRDEFNEYLDNVREVAKAVHDGVRR